MMSFQLITNLVLLFCVAPQVTVQAQAQIYTIAFGFAAPTADAPSCTEGEMTILDDIAGVALAASGYADLAVSDGWERVLEGASGGGSSPSQAHEGHRDLTGGCNMYCWELCEWYGLTQYCSCCDCCTGGRRMLRAPTNDLTIALAEIKTRFQMMAVQTKRQISCVDPTKVQIVSGT